MSGAGRRPAAADVVVLVNNLDGVFQRSVVQGVSEVAAAHGLSVGAWPLAGAAGAEAASALVAEAAAAAAGVLVLMNALTDDDLATLAAAGLPVTLVSHHAEHLELPTMMFDNHQGMAQLMRHLVVEAGRARPVFVRGDPEQLDAQERERAFDDEVVRHGLTVPAGYRLEGGFAPQVAQDSLAAFVAGGGDLDAVVASDYLMAIAAQAALRAAGLRVPQDVAVVGFGDGPEAKAADVTTVAADVVELGRRSARQLVAQLEGPPLTGRTMLSTQLVRRGSSARRG